jgi:hypothetical protein
MLEEPVLFRNTVVTRQFSQVSVALMDWIQREPPGKLRRFRLEVPE